jgi:multidrug resistance efflux pump
MDITITQEDFEVAYASLNATIRSAQKALEAYQKEKDKLEDAINFAVLQGGIEGKNETERKASIAHKFGDGQEYVRARSIEYDRARIEIQIMENEVACLRAILRLYEVAKPDEK